MTQNTSTTIAGSHLSGSAFYDAVEALAPSVAVFDCDGTLWAGDAGSSFMEWSMNTGLLSPESIAWLRGRYEGYSRSEVSELQICGEMVQVYAGLTEVEIRDAAALFFQQVIEPKIFPDLQKVVGRLQERGATLWAVSSTNQWVIEEGVRRFNIPAHRVLAARVEVVKGRLTETLVDVPTDEGKVAALRTAGVLSPDAVFGNSVHDVAMLAFGRRAFPVNPSSALLDIAARNGWPVFCPES